MLRYASGIDSEMFDEPVAVQQGPNFVEAVAILFDAELQALLRSGIRSEYRGTESTERYLRGSLNVAKQLRANPVVSRTSFNCRFNEPTADILLNQAVLSAARILARIVSEQRLSERLQSKVDRLRQRVTMRRVEAQELEQIQLSHLTAEYGNVLRLTEMVLTSSYINDYTAGDSMAFSMLIDMNQLWEQCVDRAFRDVAVNSRGLQPWSQYPLGTLVNFGNQEVSMNPDVGIESGSGDTVVVADAKWKQGSPSSSDLYQMAAYQQKGQCSGVLG
jgi:5-methylcytosine-specific restriction enzyme subunit McrC